MHPRTERRLGIDPDEILADWERPVYLVHEHFSRSHHFDLRLEFDGVLRSWAVPKGLSTEPGVRRLAMQVPDHALSYAPFEGEIPEGSYGAGKVEIWDRGTFDVVEHANDKLVVRIRGRRIQGTYHLVRATFKDDRRSWLVSLAGSAVKSNEGASDTVPTTPSRRPRAKGNAKSRARPQASRGRLQQS
jgi:DNA ligase D-like protein (predicted 3'-phosphoesterase)